MHLPDTVSTISTDAVGQRANNFDLLRLLFALVVVLVHVRVLTGFGSLDWITDSFDVLVAVHGFFVISGFLIVRSFEKDRRLWRYLQKRVRRIYPAYAVVVLVAVVVGCGLTRLPTTAYLASGSTWGYVFANLAFLNFFQPSLPGLFEDNFYPGVVNGSLWSIKIEVVCYGLVPIVALVARRCGLAAVYAAVYLLSVGLGVWCQQKYGQTGNKLYVYAQTELSGPIACFAAGAIGYVCFQWFQRWSRGLVLCAAAAWVLTRLGPVDWGGALVEPAALAVVVLFVAFSVPFLGNFGRFGDVSYGLYIFHFPIIQLLVRGGFFADRPVLFLVSVLALSTTAAFCSWHLIEKRWLRRDSHYVAAEGARVGVSHGP